MGGQAADFVKNRIKGTKNGDLASLKQHLNDLPVTKYTPKYLQDSTHLMGSPNEEIISEHCASYRGPNRIQADFLR
jgi:hypothetical protein